jgi:hypothetical protein
MVWCGINRIYLVSCQPSSLIGHPPMSVFIFIHYFNRVKCILIDLVFLASTKTIINSFFLQCQLQWQIISPTYHLVKEMVERYLGITSGLYQGNMSFRLMSRRFDGIKMWDVSGPCPLDLSLNPLSTLNLDFYGNLDH